MKSIKEFEKEFTWYTNLNHGYFSLGNLYIGHYGYEKIEETKGVVSNNNPAFRLHFITEGHLLFTVNGKTYKLKKNCCFLVRPDISTSYQGLLPPPAAYFWVSFSGSYAKRLVSQMGFSEHNPFIYIPVKHQSAIRSAFYETLNIDNTFAETTDFIFLENLMKIARILFTSFQVQTETPQKKNERPAYIEQAMTIFNNRFISPDFSVNEIARELYIHPNYFSSIFKKEMGSTFNEYLTQRRIEYATSLIRLGYTKVSQIAEMVGIPDASYFSKLYKKFEAITPSEEIEKQIHKKQ